MPPLYWSMTSDAVDYFDQTFPVLYWVFLNHIDNFKIRMLIRLHRFFFAKLYSILLLVLTFHFEEERNVTPRNLQFTCWFS